MDGGLGLRLPSLMHISSDLDDVRQIEYELYFGRFGKLRGASGLFSCIGLLIADLILPSGDWQILSVVSLMIAFGLGTWITSILVISGRR